MKISVTRLSIVVLLFSSCTMQGPWLTSGLTYTKANQQKKEAPIKKTQKNDVEASISPNTLPQAQASTTDDLETIAHGSSLEEKNVGKQTTPSKPAKVKLPKDSCDRIVTKKGEELYGIVTEIGAKSVRYTPCDNINGPAYVINKSDLVFVEFKNGKKEIFQDKPEVVVPKTPPPSVLSDTRSYDNLSLWGFVLSLIGVPFGIFGAIFFDSAGIMLLLGIFLSFTSLILSIVGQSGNKRLNRRLPNRDLAIAGIGISAFVLFLEFTVIALLIFADS